MNAIVHDATRTFGDWIAGVMYKLHRSFTRVGYAKAGRELARLGYTEQARRCFEEMKNL